MSQNEERRPGGHQGGGEQVGETRTDGITHGTVHGLPTIEYAANPAAMARWSELGQWRTAAIRSAARAVAAAADAAGLAGGSVTEQFAAASAQRDAITAEISEAWLAWAATWEPIR